MNAIRAVEVVIPARDEAELIERCLQAVISASARAGRQLRDRVDFSITVVADGCSDETASLAQGFPGVRVLEVGAVGVGAARRSGIMSALERHLAPPENTWVANTDADSYVGARWLLEQIAHADAGADVCVGGVRPDFDDLTSDQIRAWKRTHRDGRASGHIHGANLGIRASTYLSVGGFRPLEEHEDVDLVARAKGAGAHVVSLDSPDVITSGRLIGRTPGGYARYLQRDLFAAAAKGG